MVNSLEKPGVGAVFCGTQYHNAEGKKIKVTLPGPHLFFPDVTARFNAGSFLILKEPFQKIGGYDPAIKSGQHTEMSLRLIPYLLNQGFLFEYVPLPLVKVHFHGGLSITSDYNGRYLGSTATLKKHEALFKKNKEKHFDYLSVAGVCALRTNRIKEGKKLLFKAITIKPFRGVSYFRFFISHFPWIRKRMWGDKK